jgi:hypothetical protein
MLLELKNLLQQLIGPFEDLFHWLVPVTVLESLAAPTGADVVSANSGKVERLGPPERRPGGGHSGCRPIRSLTLVRSVGEGICNFSRFRGGGRLCNILCPNRIRGRTSSGAC